MPGGDITETERMSGILRSFGPVADPDARVLVLGSMPGEASLRKKEYYGHARNAFWPIMGGLFGAGPDLPYGVRLDRLRTRRVALWDVVNTCRREGSLDTAIDETSVEANDIVGLLEDCPGIALICFNGRAAENLFRVHVREGLEDVGASVRTECLPSTSPAHASRTMAQKAAAWRVVKDWADGRTRGD